MCGLTSYFFRVLIIDFIGREPLLGGILRFVPRGREGSSACGVAHQNVHDRATCCVNVVIFREYVSAPTSLRIPGLTPGGCL